jgi:hypothetical protein
MVRWWPKTRRFIHSLIPTHLTSDGRPELATSSSEYLHQFVPFPLAHTRIAIFKYPSSVNFTNFYTFLQQKSDRVCPLGLSIIGANIYNITTIKNAMTTN